jgi:hypothetical protein
VRVRARVWGDCIESVTLSVDGGEPVAMEAFGAASWGKTWDAEALGNGSHELTVSARDADGRMASDRILVYVNCRGEYSPPARREPDYENAVGAWKEKHILGTQLGPNENGHAWPRRRERASVSW